MMAAIGACPYRLFEGQIFAPPVVVKRAHRRVAIGPVQNDAADDVNARPECNRICGIPSSGVHGAQNIAFGSNQAHIDRITRNTLTGACYHRTSCQSPLMLIMAPCEWQHDVGEDSVGCDNDCQNNECSFEL